jgi:putative protein-disulfide isomerase
MAHHLVMDTRQPETGYSVGNERCPEPTMTEPHLVYFADPMCSWCWGFSPVIEAVRATYGERLPVRLIMGGLRPGNTKPMTEKAKHETRGHWEHVHEASGQPFDFAFFEREGFVYDTELPAAAVVLVRHLAPHLAFDFLKRAHAAFYAHNRDVTQPDVLADLAAELGIAREAFRDAVTSEEIKSATWRDFGTSQNAGVTGFPTLIASTEQSGHYAMVTQGFQPAENILPVIAHWFEGGAAEQRASG